MSKFVLSQVKENGSVDFKLVELGREELVAVAGKFEVKGRHAMKKDELIQVLDLLRVDTVTFFDFGEGVDFYINYKPNRAERRREARKLAKLNGFVVEEVLQTFDKEHPTQPVKSTKEAFAVLSMMAQTTGICEDESKVAEVLVEVMQSRGVKLEQIVRKPEIAGDDYKVLSPKFVSLMHMFNEYYDASKVKAPTRESYMAVLAALVDARVVVNADGKKKIVVEGQRVRQSQSALGEALVKEKRYYKLNESGQYVPCSKSDIGAKYIGNMEQVLYFDFNLPMEDGQTDYTNEQKELLFTAMNDGLYVVIDGVEVWYEYLMQTPSQQRLVQATFVSGVDAVHLLHQLGHDFRVYAKHATDGKWKIDMSKAIKRFGLSGTNTICSQLVQIGNELEYFENGDLHIVGGNVTMRVTDGVYARITKGEYRVYDEATRKTKIVNAADYERVLAVSDGAFYVDESVYNLLVAEFGVDSSAWQVRVTPFGKGLAVFVPGLKELYGADILAFDSSVKGNYETLLKNHDFKIEFRIALFNKPARLSKKYTNMPYQFSNTLPIGPESYLELLDKHLDKVFEMYENPRMLFEYLGLDKLEAYEDLSEEEMTDEVKDDIKKSLVSKFTEFLYAGEFTMKDPMMKKYVKDLIEQLIRDWGRGNIPVEGHYRFMVQDPYAVLETKRLDDLAMSKYGYSSYRQGKKIIVPPTVGIPAGHVVMVDDNDQYFVDGKYVVLQRNPKITYGETALGMTIIQKEYYEARKKYAAAFTNVVVFSAHDFLLFMQGGADVDGDTCLATFEPVIVNAVINAQGKKAYIPLLDITHRSSGNEAGELVEGCSFTNPESTGKEYEVIFDDSEYNLAFARNLHELSKDYVLKSLMPNKIGILTDYATKLLDAITKLNICLNKNVDLSGNALSPELKNFYMSQLFGWVDKDGKEHMGYIEMVNVLRLCQGWEIDRAKHGGAYEAYVDLRFTDVEEFMPYYATESTEHGRKWISPDWMADRKGKVGRVTNSLLSTLRQYVLGRYENEIVAKFNAMDPFTSDNNLLAELSLGIQKPMHYPEIVKAVRPIKRYYSNGIKNAILQKEESVKAVVYGGLNQFGLPMSSEEKAMKISALESEFSNKMAAIIEEANLQMAMVQTQFNCHPALVGIAAYEITYGENGNVNRNVKKGEDPTSGLSFPWNMTYFLSSAVRLVSGRSDYVSKVEPVLAKDVKVSFGGLQLPAERIEMLIREQGKVYVECRPIATEGALNGVYAFHVMVLQRNVEGNLYFETLANNVYANQSYIFSGHNRWEVKVKDVAYKPSNDGVVKTVTITLDDEVRPIKR